MINHCSAVYVASHFPPENQPPFCGDLYVFFYVEKILCAFPSVFYWEDFVLRIDERNLNCTLHVANGSAVPTWNNGMSEKSQQRETGGSDRANKREEDPIQVRKKPRGELFAIYLL